MTGLMRGDVILNDETFELLVQQALVQAEAGADIIAPSDMMDGRVGAIRAALDAEGFQRHAIMSYAAKYASAFYGPFRDAVGSGRRSSATSAPIRWTPPMRTRRCAKWRMDIAEGADMVMVKPGMPYLDIVRRVKDDFDVPTFAYQVSGEYAMLEAAARERLARRRKAHDGSLLAFKRAGADGVPTYFAPRAAELLRGG